MGCSIFPLICFFSLLCLRYSGVCLRLTESVRKHHVLALERLAADRGAQSVYAVRSKVVQELEDSGNQGLSSRQLDQNGSSRMYGKAKVEDDADALLALKSGISNDPLGVLKSWGVSEDPCNWAGVGCDRIYRSGEVGIRVTSLEIKSKRLEGKLSAEIGRLTELRQLILEGNKLSGPIPWQIGYCRRAMVIDLTDNQFSGSIPHEIYRLSSLEALKLSGNDISGTLDGIFSSSTAWDSPFQNLRTLKLSDNHLTGNLPLQLGMCSSLEVIHLDGNSIVGTIPDSIGFLSNLQSLFLNDNMLSGVLPPSLARCSKLQFLDVADNLINGRLPSALAELHGLRYLNVSNNQLEGPIPAGIWFKRGVDADSFSGNARLCGAPLKSCSEAMIPSAPPVSKQAFSAFVSQLLKLFLFNRVSRVMRTKFGSNHSRWARFLAEGFDTNLNHAPAPAPMPVSVNKVTTPAPSPTPPSPRRRGHKSKAEMWGLGLAVGMVVGSISAFLVALALKGILICVRTRTMEAPIIFRYNISPKLLAFLDKDDAFGGAELIGSGGAGQVYKCSLENGMVVAIKRMSPFVNESVVGDLLDESFDLTKNTNQIQAELKTLGQIRHRNLVSLLAYVSRPDYHLLVYDFMENGSLQTALQKSKAGSFDFTWPMRYNIAVGIAQGLTYLHFHCNPRIVHRDLKPANILLDRDFQPHLGDFGLAKLLPDNFTHFTSEKLAGTVGYIAPEYHQTFRYTDKCDVYSFGVVLSVLITGKEPTDDEFLEVSNMGRWIQECFQSGNAERAVDPILKTEGWQEQIVLALKICVFCTDRTPSERPSSQEVLAMLHQIGKT